MRSVDELTRERQQAQARLEAIDAAEAQGQPVGIEASSLRAQISRLDRELEEAKENEYFYFLRRMEELKDSIAGLEGDIATLSLASAAITQEMAQNTETIRLLSEKREALVADLTSQDAALTQLGEDLLVLTGAKAARQGEKKEVDARKGAAEAKLEDKETAAREKEAVVDDARTVLQNLSRQITGKGGTKERRKAIEEELSALPDGSAEQAKKRQELEKIEKEEKAIKDEIKARVAEMRARQDAAGNAKPALKETVREARALRAECEALKENLKELSVQSAGLDTEIKRLEEQEKALEQQREEMREKKRLTEEEARTLGEQIKQLEARNRELQKQKDAIDREREQKEKALAEKKKELEELQGKGGKGPWKEPPASEERTTQLANRAQEGLTQAQQDVAQRDRQAPNPTLNA